MKEQEIREKIFSNNPEVLKQMLSFVTEKLSTERVRAKTAEDRAAAMFAVSGILAGFVIHFAQILPSLGQSGWLILLSLYLASMIFLIKSSLYAILAAWNLKGYEVAPDLAFNVQFKSQTDSLREELIWKIWEYYQLLPVGNQRLHRVHRAQKNMFTSIVSFGVLSIVWFILDPVGITIKPIFETICAILIGGVVILLDKISQQISGLWKFE